MKTITLARYDAFADAPGMGNPCGVVLEADGLSGEEMQQLAFQAGFSECAFICRSEKADLRLRFFMPGRETPLCGHGTVCAFSALMARQAPAAPLTLRAETLAGELELGYDPATRMVSMEQAPARFEPFEGDLEGLLGAIGLDKTALDTRFPVVYGSTGSWTVILPIRTLEDFRKMQPQNKLFPGLLTAHPGASVHPLCLETLSPDCQLHGRHFSAGDSGVVEDPATGTACGVMGAYWLAYIAPGETRADLLIEQGQEMGRDGHVRVWACRREGQIRVKIAGRAVAGQPFTLQLP